MCKLLGCADGCGLIHRMCRVIEEAKEILKSYSIIVNRKGECSKLIFSITSVLFINRFTLVYYGFKLLNHILKSKQWF